MNDSRFNKTFIIQPALGSDSYLSGTTFDNNTIYYNMSNAVSAFTTDLSSLVLNDTIVEPTINNFPANGLVDSVYIAQDTGYMYRWNGSGYSQLTDQTAIWGEISGTLSNQTDLQNALDGKADNADVFSGDYNDLSNLPNLSTVATSGNYDDLLNLPNLSIYVDKSSNETIGGEKTFTSNSIFNGNVGIGTTSPSTKLDVFGTIKGTVVVDNNGNTLSQKIDSKTINEPVGSDKVANIVSLTQAEYDAATPISTTFYIITD